MKQAGSIRYMYGVLALLLSACTASPQWRDQAANIAPASAPPEGAPPSYVRLYDAPVHPKLQRRVNANFSPGHTTLQNALVLALPFTVSLVPMDEGVDLTQRVAVRAQGVAVRDYIRQLESLVDYRILPNEDASILRISSTITRSWNLAALAGMGQFKARLGFDADDDEVSEEDGEGGFQSSHSMSVRQVHEDEVWDAVVQHAHCVLRTNECAAGEAVQRGVGRKAAGNGKPGTSASADAWVVENRRTGMITAAGSPQKIARLDAWMRTLSAGSERLVHLECAILDIVVKDEQAFGVELSALFRDGDFSGRLVYDNAGAASAESGDLLVGAGFSGRHFDLTALIRNLSNAADVRIQDRVRLAVTNGATAYLNTGEVFSYISDVDTSVSEVGTTTAYQQSRLQVGLELAVTPRFLSSGDRMLIEVTPVLSALLRYDELGTGGARLRTPVIALRQMSSQAVTSSGRPVVVGGLESNRSSRRDNGVLAPEALRGVLSSRADESESRQLLIIVTPWEIT